MTYIIGDVHGHYDVLLKLVEKIPKGSEIIFVGDLIDRGPKSAVATLKTTKKTKIPEDIKTNYLKRNATSLTIDI